MQSSSAHDAATRSEARENLADAHVHRPLTAAQVAVVLAYVLAGISYLSWRTGVFNPDAAAFSAAFYAVEFLGFLSSLLALFVCWRLSHRVAGVPQSGLSVDVFVEGGGDAQMTMLERTLIAARDMEYPHLTWLLDDANRPEAEALAASLGVCYQGRGGGDSARACALRRSRAAFIALFDARDVPSSGFLWRTLGFFRDEAVAFVQTPRHVRAVDALQRESASGTRLVSQDLWRLFRVVQRGRDAWNAALFCGSCAVFRRAALDKAGGLGARGTAEERRLSLRLHARGYKSVYAAEPLATGISSPDLAQHLAGQEGEDRAALTACLRSLCERGLTLPQRLCYLQAVMAPLEAWRKSLLWLIPIVAIAMGVLPVAAFDDSFLLHFLPYFILGLWAFEETNRGVGSVLSAARLDLARIAGCLAVPGQGDPHGLARSLWLAAAVGFAMAPTGLLLHGVSMPMLMLGAWALVNAILATATFLAIRKPDLPGNAVSAFPLPLPACMKFPDGAPVYGVIDQISCTGFRFHGRFPEYARFGAKVEGKLFLPGAALSFSGSLRSLFLGQPGKEGRFAESAGLSFDWVGAPGQQLFDRLLGASVLHARVATLVAGRPTPVERLARVLGIWALSPRPADWAPVLVRAHAAPRDQAGVGMIARATRTGQPLLLLSFAPIPERSRLHVAVVGDPARQSLIGRVDHRRLVDTPLAPLYVYSFTGDRHASAAPVKPRPSPAGRYARPARR